MKKVVSIGLVMVLALAMSSGAPQSQTRVAVAQPLLDRTAAGEEISVIVGVGARFVPEGNLAGDAAVADQRASMGQMLDDTMARAAAVGVTVGSKFESIPYFTARVNRAQLEALATTAGVSSINEDYQLSTSLNVSTGMINAPAAWAAGATGAGWGVAVLDTGVELAHSFLAGRIASQACYSTTVAASGPNPATTSLCPSGNSDTSGGGACASTIEGCDHGTHVAGITAGANGPVGTNGVAPGAAIHAIQVFSGKTTGCPMGFSACTTAWTSDIIRGLQRVLALHNAGSKIAAVNMSLGGGRFFTEAACDSANAATKAAIDNLRSVGIASVIASGNDAFADSLSSPGCISTAVAVGATTKGVCTGPSTPANIGCPNNAVPGQISVPAFSNVAPFLDLYAPGSFINSAVPGNSYLSKSGTSMATPHVAGAWAVIKQVAPAASVSTVLAAFAATGTPITEPFTGLVHPMINVNAARLALGGGGGGGAPGAPTSFAATVSGFAVNMTWGAPASGGAPTGYTLVARTVSGGPVALTLPLGNVNAFGVTAPNGVFYLTVVASNASGPGPESNSVAITVPNVGPPPGAPTGLTVSVTGDTAVFNFTAPASGGPVTNFVLLGGLTPGFAAPVASLPLGPTQTAVAIPGVPPGTWYARVVAQNAAGVSLPTNEVSFSVAGPTPPGAPTLNPAVVVGNTVSLSWAAGAGGAPNSYTLFAAATPGGAPFLSAPLGGNAIAFGGVPAGTYYVRMVAHNALGTSLPSNEITIVVP